MRGTKRSAISDSAPICNSNDSIMQSKRVIVGSPFAADKSEPSIQQPPLDAQRAESSKQHVRALNTQFASWVQAQLQNHPDELWEDGVQDYLNHSKSIMEKFSDVVNWLKAHAAKAESSSEFRSSDAQIKPTSEIDKSSHKLFLDKPGFPVAATASFTNSWSPGIFSNNNAPFTFGGNQVPAPGNANSGPSNRGASNEADGEGDVEQPSSPSVKKSEEKGITIMHEVKCKLYVKSSDPADKDAWKDKGMGQLSIKCKEGVSKGTKESKPTIVIRNDVGKVLLNALLYPGIKTNLQKNSVVAIFHTSGDGDNNDTVVARTFLIRTKTEEDPAAIFSSLRRQRSPSLEVFLAPVNISSAAILETVRAISAEVISSFSGANSTTPFFQRKNSRSLIRKIQVISVLLDAFRDVGFSKTASTLFLCLKELYLLLYRSKILIDYVKGSSKLWLLLQNHSISGHFHDLNQEISTLLDVFPLSELNLSEDVKEQVELLCKQSRKSNLFIDKHDDLSRLKLYHFLTEFENGRGSEGTELHTFFVKKLGICNVKSCRFEIEFLEEQIVNHDGDIEPTASVLNGLVALMRYCRFLLFRFEDEEFESEKQDRRKTKKGLITQEIADTFITISKDFCCPISLDLMKDPVIISTGQTYERSSIARWMQEGHSTCPKTGQMLVHTKLVPNRALRNLINQWCVANGIPYDPPENPDYSSESALATYLSKAAIEATKATANLLVEKLEDGTTRAKTVAAREIRLLAKTGKENRAAIAEAGAIPLLKRLLSSSDPFGQENSVTAILNLSIYDKNKGVIMDEEGCLGAIVEVLRNGHTTEARENAAATLFSLSAVHEYKKQIAQEDWAIEALAGLLREGTSRGKKDAVTALFNLSTHSENCARMVESGAITALVEALGCEGISEEAASVLALIVRQPIGAEAVGREETAVKDLIGMMRCGTPRGKENAVAVLLELCRNGGAAERVVKDPAFAGLLQILLFTGTKRARRKAASLARVFQRCENGALHFGGFGVNYGYAGNSAAARDTSFAGDVAMSVSISVPVL